MIMRGRRGRWAYLGVVCLLTSPFNVASTPLEQESFLPLVAVDEWDTGDRILTDEEEWDHARRLGSIHFTIEAKDKVTGQIAGKHVFVQLQDDSTLPGGEQSMINITDGSARTYLNDLIHITSAAADKQLTNIAFVKTHKTASTTLAALLYRYARRHGSRLAHFDGYGSRVPLEEAVVQTKKTGQKVDIMHYHMSLFGNYEGTWQQAENRYRQIMRDGKNVNFLTVMREPRTHLLSYYYYFLQPNTKKSIDEFLTGPGKRGDKNHKRIHNPLATEFGIKSKKEMEKFIKQVLPRFKLVLLTERFDESLMVLRHLMNWNLIDMTYVALLKTEAGKTRFDKKPLLDIPHFDTLRPEVRQAIDKATQLDQMFYAAATEEFEKRYRPIADQVATDMVEFTALQSLIVDYLDSNSTSKGNIMYRKVNIYGAQNSFLF